jgi:transcriptional regulator with XRE-family HTH domain
MALHETPDKGRLGRKLREARKAERLSQSDIAEAFGFDTSTISRAEQGRMTVALVFFLILFFVFMKNEKNMTTAIQKVKRIYPLTAKKLRKQREDLGLTQAELADILGVKRLTVFRWEKGIFDRINSPSYRWLALEMKLLKEQQLKEKKKEAA